VNKDAVWEHVNHMVAPRIRKLRTCAAASFLAPCLLLACSGEAPVGSADATSTGGTATDQGQVDAGGGTGGTPTGGSSGEGSTGGTSSESGGSTSSGGETQIGGENRHVIGDGPITIDGRQILVGGTPIHVRGVCWNPVVRGGSHPDGLDFDGLGEIDIPLMQAAGINAVRTYTSLTDVNVLDRLHAAGIKVIMSVYIWGGAEPSSVLTTINAVKDHPAILMWMVGNEWNYNGLYVGLSFDESLARMQETAQIIKQADPNHPVATSYGEVPSADTISRLSAIDVWGINTYRGITFGNLFSTWENLSTLPMIVSEFGADAWDARNGGSENLAAQAEATASLVGAIEDDAARDGGIVSGGTIFEWSDEWWKDGEGDPNQHDVGGWAPGGGPHPDQTFNEEWWGIVTLDRQTRPAYDELQTLFLTP